MSTNEIGLALFLITMGLTAYYGFISLLSFYFMSTLYKDESGYVLNDKEYRIYGFAKPINILITHRVFRFIVYTLATPIFTFYVDRLYNVMYDDLLKRNDKVKNVLLNTLLFIPVLLSLVIFIL